MSTWNSQWAPTTSALMSKSGTWTARAIALSVVFALHVGVVVLFGGRPSATHDATLVWTQLVDIPSQPKPTLPMAVDLRLPSLPLPEVPIPEITIENASVATAGDAPALPIVLASIPANGGSNGAAQPSQGVGGGSGSTAERWTQCTNRIMPAHPPNVNREGKVTLLVPLDERGAFGKITVLHSSGSRQLDLAAIAAVKRWKCSPVLQDGHPVAVIAKQEIEFLLRR